MVLKEHVYYGERPSTHWMCLDIVLKELCNYVSQDSTHRCGSSTSVHTTQLYCILAFFGFYFHKYAFCTFISKNGSPVRRHYYWRRPYTSQRQGNWRLDVWCGGDVAGGWCHRSWRRGRRQDLWRRAPLNWARASFSILPVPSLVSQPPRRRRPQPPASLAPARRPA